MRYRSLLTVMAAFAVAVMPFAPGAHAAPFCVQTQGVPPQCLYVDSASCDAYARRVGGYCTVNMAELQIAPGIGHFCLLTAGPVASCFYADSPSCEAEAKRQHGVCITAPSRAESPPPDPFRSIRPLTVGGGARE